MRTFASFVGLIALALGVHAQTAATAVATKSFHPWQSATPAGTAEAYFTNLKSGDTIETPFLLKFGLSGGWGLAPISKPMGGKSGHHHLLVNRDLPLDFKAALPFNEQYIHFGKGQMETVLTLAPGIYTLRMLLADDKHLPHFVYSKPLKVTVIKKNETDPNTLVSKGIALQVAGVEVKTPFRVQFHASGLNVAHAVQQEKDTGHFRLTVVSKAGPVAEMDFTEGQTETWLAPPAGDYTLKLEFLDNLNPKQALAGAVSTAVRVQP
ncbi:MAG: DUF4399 domain-containing protein [Curvibacter sp.]|nr:MAG: DUF4399 domain-containing protein [Curvibacter sp.]